MARVHFVNKAAKDYPEIGVKKGESYYWWQHFRGPKQMSKERPKPSQTASGEYARAVLGIIESLEAWEGEWTEADRDDLVSELEALRDEEQDKFDNMPEGLQQGDTGVLIEERISALEDWIAELEGLDFETEAEGAREQALATAISV